MKIKAYILAALAVVLFVAPITGQLRADPGPTREYHIKAAFLYNFIKFIEWPQGKVTADSEAITIGIIGADPFGSVFEPIKDKQLKGKKVTVKRFKGFDELRKSGRARKIESLKKCHLLFICSSEQDNWPQIINALRGSYVLTVSETKGFLEAGGIINFMMKGKKVHFEINVTAADQAKLKVRSKLLRLAERLLEEKQTAKAKN